MRQLIQRSNSKTEYHNLRSKFRSNILNTLIFDCSCKSLCLRRNFQCNRRFFCWVSTVRHLVTLTIVATTTTTISAMATLQKLNLYGHMKCSHHNNIKNNNNIIYLFERKLKKALCCFTFEEKKSHKTNCNHVVTIRKKCWLNVLKRITGFQILMEFFACTYLSN